MTRTLLVAACAAVAAAAGRPCDSPRLKGTPFCDATLSNDARAAWMVSQLSLAEKALLSGNTARPAHGLPAYEWWSEALHGVAHSPGVHFDEPTKNATGFPQIILTSASWNQTLWSAIGGAISTEARVMNNFGHAGLTFWTPNVNVVRDPRWGRGQETPGEDVFLGVAYAKAYVPKLQHGEDKKYLKISACCKHFYGYDLENWGGVDRHHFDAIIGKQDEADTFLPAFHACVASAKVSSLMCSYNSVNGVPSCANKGLLKDLARDAWGFDGYITSDCGAIADIYNTHKYADIDNTVRLALEAGTDSDCGFFYRIRINDSVTHNVTQEASLDAALTNLFKTQLRLGMFDPVEDQPYLKLGLESLNTPAHQQLALEAAQQGIVLLKNAGEALPLKKGGVYAAVGKDCDGSLVMLGNYHGDVPYFVTPLDGIHKYAFVPHFVRGCDTVACPVLDTAKVTADLEAAEPPSAAFVVLLGLDQTLEAEGHDRTEIGLPENQHALLNLTIGAAAGKPVVVVIMAGSSLDLSALKANPGVSAIVWAGYPGQSGGQAIADVLFGEVNPSGRLTISQYPTSYTAVSYFDMGLRPNATSGNPGRTYRFYTGPPPAYVFGEGYSYTTFTYAFDTPSYAVALADVQAGCAQANAARAYSPTDADAPVLTVSATVTNTGARAGASVVQLFAKAPGAGADGAPLKSLVAFNKVYLEPQESVTVQLPVTYSGFALSQTDGSWGTKAGAWTLALNFDDAATAAATLS